MLFLFSDLLLEVLYFLIIAKRNWRKKKHEPKTNRISTKWRIAYGFFSIKITETTMTKISNI
jgi:hypothetical protein